VQEQKIAIIIVNWNTGECLADCLRSLAKLPEKDLIEEVTVIDNASRDRSIAAAKQAVSDTGNRPAVRFIMNKRNAGFAAANNIGLRRLEQRGSQAHVLLLNPDTVALPGLLSGMLEVFKKSERIGIVGPKLLNADQTLQPSVRYFPRGKEMALYMLKLGSQVKEAKIDYGQEQVVPQVMGAIFLIRRECWQQVGQLDEGYFVWFEEVDYCRRAYELGWQVWYTPRAYGIHLGGVSFRQVVGIQKNWPWLKSMLRYARKHLSAPVVIGLYIMSIINVLLWIPASVRQWQHKMKTEQI
jgi:hypothetical protein